MLSNAQLLSLTISILWSTLEMLPSEGLAVGNSSFSAPLSASLVRLYGYSGAAFATGGESYFYLVYLERITLVESLVENFVSMLKPCGLPIRTIWFSRNTRKPPKSIEYFRNWIFAEWCTTGCLFGRQRKKQMAIRELSVFNKLMMLKVDSGHRQANRGYVQTMAGAPWVSAGAPKIISLRSVYCRLGKMCLFAQHDASFRN